LSAPAPESKDETASDSEADVAATGRKIILLKNSIDTASSAGDAFRPSRRVRDVPGGHHTDIFATDEDDALSTAPRRESSGNGVSDLLETVTVMHLKYFPKPAGNTGTPVTATLPDEIEHEGINFESSFKPSR